MKLSDFVNWFNRKRISKSSDNTQPSITFTNDPQKYVQAVVEGMWEYSDLGIYVISKDKTGDEAWACITFSVSDKKDGPRKRAQITIPWALLRNVLQTGIDSLDDSGFPIHKASSQKFVMMNTNPYSDKPN